MSKSKRKRIPKEFESAIELITDITPQITDFTTISLLPDTGAHVAPHFQELYKSLELSYEIRPPAGEQYIDIGDQFPLIVRVSNVYRPTSGLPPFWRPTIKVWFKDVDLYVSGTDKATIVNPVPWNLYHLVEGNKRLRPGQTVEKEITLEAIAEVSEPVDPVERVAHISVKAKLDVEALFSYKKAISAYTQIRAPLPP